MTNWNPIDFTRWETTVLQQNHKMKPALWAVQPHCTLNIQSSGAYLNENPYGEILPHWLIIRCDPGQRHTPRLPWRGWCEASTVPNGWHNPQSYSTCCILGHSLYRWQPKAGSKQIPPHRLKADSATQAQSRFCSGFCSSGRAEWSTSAFQQYNSNWNQRVLFISFSTVEEG